MSKLFKIYDLKTRKVLFWDVKQMLAVINKDRGSNWEPYTEKNYIEGWNIWVEGDTHRCFGVKY